MHTQQQQTHIHTYYLLLCFLQIFGESIEALAGLLQLTKALLCILPLQLECLDYVAVRGLQLLHRLRKRQRASIKLIAKRVDASFGAA